MIDPAILNDFRLESNQLLDELKGIISRFEDDHPTFPDHLLTEYAQKIDRIMGAAQTLGILAPEHVGLKSIGTLAELCKSIGYKAAQKKELTLMPMFAAFLTDTIEVIETLVTHLDDVEKSRKTASDYSPVLQGRLAWLKSKT